MAEEECKIMCSLLIPHSMAVEARMKRTNRDETAFHFHCTSCEHHLNCTDRQGPFGLEKNKRRFARLLRKFECILQMRPMILNCNTGTCSQPFEKSAANQRTQGGTQPKSCLITSSELTSKVLESQCAK